jgi:hypothetical protein
MVRFLQPWGKKRGSRLAARAFSGVVGEAAFFAGLFLLGVFSLALTIIRRLSDETLAETPLGLGFWCLVITGGTLVIAGGGGVVYRILQVGASSERRSMLAQRAALDRAGPGSGEAAPLPNVPRGDSLTDSPGIRLAYRLPTSGSPVVGVAAAAALALLWSGLWVVLLVVVITGLRQGRPRWVLTGLLLPFGAIGFWALRYFVAQLRATAGVGATIAEISAHPLRPGETCRLYVAQYGRLKLRRLRVELVCEEESTFRQGTDVRTDRHRASTELIHQETNVRIDLNRPWEQEFTLHLPGDAMHSFQSPHHALQWKVVVSGESRPWPSFSRSFPVVVHPRQEVLTACR